MRWTFKVVFPSKETQCANLEKLSVIMPTYNGEGFASSGIKQYFISEGMITLKLLLSMTDLQTRQFKF